MNFTYGSIIPAPYVMPHPTKRNEYVAEMRDAEVIGFSNYAAFKRGWGFAGDVLCKFPDGKTCWTRIYR